MVSGASGAARSQKAQSWKGPNTIGTRERAWQKRQKTRRDIQRRTRRSASTIGGAAPDSIIGRAAADRAGARPYRAHVAKTRSHAGARPYRRLLLLRPQHFFELLHLWSYDEPAISLIRVFREIILMIILRLVKNLERHDLGHYWICLLYTSPSPRDRTRSRMPSSA